MTPEQERLVLTHRNLVPAALNALGGMRRYWDRDGLIGAGNVALVQAALRYDPALGVPFNRYAFTRIRGAIIDEARYGSFGSRRVHDDAIALHHAAAQLDQVECRPATEAELATQLDWTAGQVRRALLAAAQTNLTSLDARLELTGAEPADPDTPDAAYAQAETVREVRAAIAALRPRHRGIVTAYYLHGRGQDDIAAEYGVTPSRICQILAAARNRMRPSLTAAQPNAA